ncbi:MAG: aminotransferase class I/II-fold pyridoxal phosphate-dependent enzyme [Acidobacteriota bacterium]
MTLHALRFDAVNLGQGFPDFDGPDEIKEIAVRTLRDGHNQYVPMPGTRGLRRAVAEHQERFWGLRYDPETEITITNGATEAIHSAIQGLCDPGDEVVFFEPFYDSYRACVAMAGAVDRVVTLEHPGFAFDPERLEHAVGPRTRAILLNTPHNPTGKVFTRAELEHIAELARRHDLIVIADEVYEHLVFDGEHVPIASLDGMRERTVTISSAGKSFSFTGWKVGWACAPPELTRALRTAHQFIVFCNSGPLQPAIAAALRLGDDYFDSFLTRYRAQRDLLCAGLADAGFGVEPPAGTYFVLADFRPLGLGDDIPDDVTLCRVMPERVGVAAIPPTAFYVDKAAGSHLLRFAFCKSEPVLEEGLRRLRGLRAEKGAP